MAYKDLTAKERKKRLMITLVIHCTVLIFLTIALVQAFFSSDAAIITFFINIMFGDLHFARLFLLILTIGLFGVLIWGTSYALKLIAQTEARENTYSNAQQVQSRAKVISKLMQAEELGSVYYVTFDLADRTRKSFTVTAMQYNAVLEGEIGLLTYKENGMHLFFVNFQPQG